jgi:hypothetical protein
MGLPHFDTLHWMRSSMAWILQCLNGTVTRDTKGSRSREMERTSARFLFSFEERLPVI